MEFYSSGKLMLTCEYMVLAGAKALAVPTKKGQKMEVTPNQSVTIHWKSIDCHGNCWFENTFNLFDFSVEQSVDAVVEDRLKQLFQHIKSNSETLDTATGFDIITTLEFDRQWGLGSSSTLVANLAKWSKVDPIRLLHAAFRGSGYDVATGIENQAILYQFEKGKPTWETISYEPAFSHQLFFVHLGQKQLSEKEVKKFNIKKVTHEDVALFSQFTDELMTCETLHDFSYLVNAHEAELSKILNRPTIKYKRFRDYPFAIKSLGGWGGDFVLAVGNPEDQNYFKNKGYNTILSWDEMVKSI